MSACALSRCLWPSPGTVQPAERTRAYSLIPALSFICSLFLSPIFVYFRIVFYSLLSHPVSSTFHSAVRGYLWPSFSILDSAAPSRFFLSCDSFFCLSTFFAIEFLLKRISTSLSLYRFSTSHSFTHSFSLASGSLSPSIRFPFTLPFHLFMSPFHFSFYLSLELFSLAMVIAG